MNTAKLECGDRSLTPEERLGHVLALCNGLNVAAEALLARIGSYNDLLEEELDGNPAASAYLRESTALLMRAVSWCGAFSGSFEPAVEFEPIDLAPLLQSAVERSSRILPLNCTIEFEPASESLVVQGSLFLLQSLFSRQLGMYSRRHCSDVDEIVLESREMELSQDTLSLVRSQAEPGVFAVVALRPRSHALSPSHFRGFWDAFFAGDMSDSDAEVDMLQSYGVVLQHGGDVFLQQNDDRVPCICFALPVRARREEMQALTNIDDSSLFGNETILLVDDEDMIWDVIIDMLQELGYSVVLAENGQDAVDIYRENPGVIDLVMLDMIMPKLDGHQAFFQLREIDEGVCVLLSSGYVSESDVQDVLEAGAAGFLQKPYRMVDLAKRIRSILDSRPG